MTTCHRVMGISTGINSSINSIGCVLMVRSCWKSLVNRAETRTKCWMVPDGHGGVCAISRGGCLITRGWRGTPIVDYQTPVMRPIAVLAVVTVLLRVNSLAESLGDERAVGNQFILHFSFSTFP